MPGMQKPHCTPAATANARENRCRSAPDRPSSVKTECPAADTAVIAQVTFACPSTSARQQPHCPCGEQPSLSDRMPHRSRSVSSSDSSARGSTRTGFPFSVNSTAMNLRSCVSIILSSMRTLLRHGTIVNADGQRRADILVESERIAAIGVGLPDSADCVIDATGRLLLPGGVDVHTHLDMPFGDIRTADDFASGTIAAACGGTTTVIDYATQTKGGSLREALDQWMARAQGRAVVDFGFHVCLADLRPDVEDEMAGLVAAGVTSFKLFMAYPGRLMLNDDEIFQVLRRAADVGGLVCLHAEDGPAIDLLVREALAAGHTAPVYHARTRPPAVEAEAVRRGIALAEKAGAALYIVHLSSAPGLEQIAGCARNAA